MEQKEKLRQLAEDIPALCLAMKEKDTPFLAKILAGTAVVYALSPIDLIPDFIPVIGYLDDLILLPLLVALTLKLIPDETFERCREQARQMYQQGMKKHWYYMLPIILIWAILILLVGKLLFF
ncbi:YkvA family protein [Negativibacillus massiliensis]|uniref:YkvA family protein n=1 Tax=Negativibacillus massiliensis TaxID=1871035 RepID=UPI0023F525CF|nr:YkvA family protein [Negativibacillus massiliensis]MCI6347209.1 YkvA family protein [Negativibacillus massiliensis]MDY4046665.1 YkvA family protein [Negativibacillus massiliensis]